MCTLIALRVRGVPMWMKHTSTHHVAAIVVSSWSQLTIMAASVYNAPIVDEDPNYVFVPRTWQECLECRLQL